MTLYKNYIRSNKLKYTTIDNDYENYSNSLKKYTNNRNIIKGLRDIITLSSTFDELMDDEIDIEYDISNIKKGKPKESSSSESESDTESESESEYTHDTTQKNNDNFQINIPADESYEEIFQRLTMESEPDNDFKLQLGGEPVIDDFNVHIANNDDFKISFTDCGCN